MYRGMYDAIAHFAAMPGVDAQPAILAALESFRSAVEQGLPPDDATNRKVVRFLETFERWPTRAFLAHDVRAGGVSSGREPVAHADKPPPDDKKGK